jgi:hypothetical protein
MVAQNIDRNTKLQNCNCCQTICRCGDCTKCTPKLSDIKPPQKPVEHRHDIQFIRCHCGLSLSSFTQWKDHFLYRYMLQNSRKFPINPRTQEENHIPIDMSYLSKEITEEVIELLREHSGEHSNDL